MTDRVDRLAVDLGSDISEGDVVETSASIRNASGFASTNATNGLRIHLDTLSGGSFRFVDRMPIKISGWAINPRTSRAVKVRVHIGKRVHEAAAVARDDLPKDIFVDRSQRYGFEVVAKVPFGIHRLKVEFVDSDGSSVSEPALIFIRTELRFFGRHRESRRHRARVEKFFRAAELEEIRRHIATMLIKPTFSVVIDARRSKKWLDATLRSVEGQLYRNLDAHLLTGSDDVAVPVTQHLHISRLQANDIGKLKGDFVIFIDSGTTLDRYATYEFANAINASPDLDLIYGDESWGEGRRNEPFIKPDWSPDYLETFNYIGSCACFRLSLARQCFKTGNAYDFVLRFTELTSKIFHVRKVLCSHRVSRAAVVEDAESNRRALGERLIRTGRVGNVSARKSVIAGHHYPYKLTLQEQPLVSIVIPTAAKIIEDKGRTIDLIKNCVMQIQEKSSYKNTEIIIVDNDDLDLERAHEIRTLRDCEFITYGHPKINIARKLNLGASIASGEFLLLLNDDIELINADWIERMLEHFEKPHVGVVGAKLLYSNQTVQHVGVALARGNPDHVKRFSEPGDEGYFFSSVGPRNFLAVTGACMMTRRCTYEEVGGYTEDLAISFNDVDYCLKVGRLGLFTVCAPQAKLYHLESRSRKAFLDPNEWLFFHTQWADTITIDPFYNELGLTINPPTFEPAFNKRYF